MIVRRLTLYLDTSVIGGYYDDEFYVDTQQLFMKNGYAILDIRSPKNLISYDEDEKI